MSAGASNGDRSLSTAAGQEPATTDPPIQPPVEEFLKFHGGDWRETFDRGYTLRQMARTWSSLQNACSVRGIKPFDPDRSKLIPEEDSLIVEFYRLYGHGTRATPQEYWRNHASQKLKGLKNCPAFAVGRSAEQSSDPAAVDPEWVFSATLDQLLLRSLHVPKGETRQAVTENLRDLARASTGGYISIKDFEHKCRLLVEIDRLMQEIESLARTNRPMSLRGQIDETQTPTGDKGETARKPDGGLLPSMLDIWKNLQNQTDKALSLLYEQEFFIGLEGTWQRLLFGTSVRGLGDTVASDWYESLRMVRQQQRTEKGCLELTERSRMLYEIDELMRLTRFQFQEQISPYFYNAATRRPNEQALDEKFRTYSRQRWANSTVDGWTDGRTDRRTDGRTEGRTDGGTDGQTDGPSAVTTTEQWDHVKRDFDDWKAGWRDGLDYLTVHDGFFTGRGNMAFSLGVKSCVVVQTVDFTEALANCSMEDLLAENGPDEASWVFEKAWLLNEIDRLMTFIRDSLQGHGYYTCDLEVVPAMERKLEESCNGYYCRFAGSAEITEKLNYCREQYRIWKGLGHHYSSPLWLATEGFISSLNDLPLRSLEDILLFTGTVGQARVRRVYRRWATIIRMSFISKCLDVEAPDIWTTFSSAKIEMLSKGLSVMVTEHTHAIAFMRPSVHPSVRPSVRPSVQPSVRQFDNELLKKLAGIANIVQVNASRRSPWDLTLATVAYITFRSTAVTVENFSGTLTSWEEPMLAENFRRCFGRPDGLAPNVLADIRQCADQVRDPAERLRVRACLKNWDDWNRSGGFAENMSGIGATIWQDIEVLTMVEIFMRKVMQIVKFNGKTHAMHVGMECGVGGAPNVCLINIMTVYTKKEIRLHGSFVRSLKVLL
ncbi:hypothetical protein BV898_05713 [Hypsibius exemplaris]|uniref:Uncharacterized protein n=1 Tax=Hypsibius exemplaris TaxID=2072580 RepID=A0A1W0WYZ8_HYPEX|nr:hypothetical protein BV898_05713 [Hypsibius exemplaris]